MTNSTKKAWLSVAIVICIAFNIYELELVCNIPVTATDVKQSLRNNAHLHIVSMPDKGIKQTNVTENSLSSTAPRPDRIESHADRIERQYSLDLKYGAMLTAAGVSQEKSDRIESLIVDDQYRRQDIIEAAQNQGISLNDPGILRMIEQDSKRMMQAEQRILGTDLYPKFHEFERETGARDILLAVAGVGILGGEGTSPVVSQETIKTVASSSKNYLNGGDSIAADIDWSQMATKLPANQVFALQVIQQGRLAASRLKGIVAMPNSPPGIKGP